MCVHLDHETTSSLTRRQLLRAGVVAAAGVTASPVLAPAAAALSSGADTVLGQAWDLTHELYAGFPSYPPLPPPERAALTPEESAPSPPYVQQWSFVEHAGTHLDAPAHFSADGAVVPELQLAQLVLRLAVIDISGKVFTSDGSGTVANADAAVTAQDIMAWERQHGSLPKQSAVLMRSGWDRFADRARTADPATKYRNVGDDGAMHFPGFAPDAIDYLLQHKAGVRAIGVDTLSLDPGRTPGLALVAHQQWLGSGRVGLENVTRLEAVPARGATLVIGVPPWERGSGGPCRLLAFA